MFCTVYQLKKDGERLPPEVARTNGVRGDLRLSQKRPGGMPCSEALLFDAQGKPLLRLSGASVRIIEGQTMLVRGSDAREGSWEYTPQVWCCVLD